MIGKVFENLTEHQKHETEDFELFSLTLKIVAAEA